MPRFAFFADNDEDIGDYASDSEYDLAVLLPHNFKPIDDSTMRLAIYVSGIRPSDVTIFASPIGKFAEKSKPSYELSVQLVHFKVTGL